MMKLATVVLALLASAAQAQEWTYLTHGSNGAMYIDLSSIRQHGPYVKAWSRFDFESPQTSKGYPTYSYQSERSLDYFNCKSETYATKQAAYYQDQQGLGAVVHSVALADAQLDFRDPIPGTVGQTLLRRACSRRR